MGKSWSELLPELLELISDRLPLVDYISFRGVCHRWRSTPSGRSKITNFSKKSLWFLFYDCQVGGGSNDDGAKCYLYCQSHPKPCTIRLPHLRGASVVRSNCGWLLAHRDGQFFFYNPFTLEKIDLPRHAIAEEQICKFTAAPTDPNCAVFIVSRWEDSALEVSSYVVGDHGADWTTRTLEVSKAQISRMVGVGCCSCRIIGNKVCVDNNPDCICRDKIFIYGSKNLFCTYNYASNLVKWGNRPHSNNKPVSFIVDSYNKLALGHRRDWLRKFGENGVLVSICAVRAFPPGVTAKRKGFWARTESVKVGKRAKVNRKARGKPNLVKATWVEPAFGSRETS